LPHLSYSANAIESQCLEQAVLKPGQRSRLVEIQLVLEQSPVQVRLISAGCHIWPPRGFALIVLSEVCFYLSAAALAELADHAKQSLLPAGTLLACHWRHPLEGFKLDGDAVHKQLHAHLGLPRLLRHQDCDMIMEVWSPDGRSVAQRGGFV